MPRKISRLFTPPRVILLGYIIIIFIGACLLSLPIASTGSRCSFIDSIFTSTSGICVTGLIVKDTPHYFTKFGKTILLILIQLGGLGYMTIASLLFIVLKKRLSIRQTTVTEEAMGYPFGGIGKFILQVVKFTIGFELFGALVLTLCFWGIGFNWANAIFKGVFHSVSAFCNAGFALFSDSLAQFICEPWIIFTMSGLFIVGGLGFIVIREIHQRIRKERTSFTLHTKLVLLSTIVLLGIGTILILAIEWKGCFANLPVWCKLQASFFQSATPRTAGFQVVRIGEYRPATRLISLIFMFIGASPGGTGGGIKTTTVVLILMSIYAYFRGKKDINGFGRSIDSQFVNRAFIIASVSILIVGGGMLILSLSEPSKSFSALLFEEISAFGTVGLSVGSAINPSCSLSYDFTNLGKIVIILTMLAGRVGSLTIGTAFIHAVGRETFKLPKESVLTG